MFVTNMVVGGGDATYCICILGYARMFTSWRVRATVEIQIKSTYNITQF